MDRKYFDELVANGSSKGYDLADEFFGKIDRYKRLAKRVLYVCVFLLIAALVVWKVF